MIISVQKYFRLILSLSVVAIIGSCGGDKKDPVSNSTDPAIYYSHSVFLKNGQAYTSGANANGQLGDGDNDETKNKDTPVQVVGEGGNGLLTGLAGVATGQTHSLAVSSLSSGGNVFAWGNNGNRQLGTSSESPAVEPTKTVKTDGSALGNITAVSAGSNFSIALDQTGNVWAWGDNSVGQLGFASPDPAHAAQLPAPLNIAKISAGGLHALAIDNTGKAYSWGKNVSGQLGFDTSTTTPPGIVLKENGTTFGSQLTDVTDIAAGGSHSLFLVTDPITNIGTVWACGYNFYGQLGTSTTDRSNKIHGAAQVLKTLNTPLTGVLAVAAGLSHSLAIIDRYTDINGQEHLRTVWGWGLNFYGQLGNPLNYLTVTPVFSPVPVLKVDGSYLENITMIIAIGNHSLAVDNNGQLWAWGNDGYGQLGIGDIGTDTTRRYATMVPGFATGSFSP